MPDTCKTIHYPLLILVIAATIFCAVVGLKRLTIDSDLSRSLPANDPVIRDSLTILAHHAMRERLAIDLADTGGPDTLASAADRLRTLMRQSGLFAEVGMESLTASLPKLRRDVIAQLPILFSSDELNREVLPRLRQDKITAHLTTAMNEAVGLAGIGQAESLAADPFNLHQIVMAKLVGLNPAGQSRIHRGNPLSEDGQHMLVVATPRAAGADTEAARQLRDFFQMAEVALRPDFPNLRLTPVGAWRAALDNETLIREDVRLALSLSTGGIALLLLLAFPRPLFSLLSMLPPIAGTACAIFIYSLFHSSISVMVLGFAGALISLMDDFSITYLLFLDRKQITHGKQAAAEVQSIGGALALFTTIIAFAALAASDFPVFAALGEFTALGMICTFLFIHFICPRLLPRMPAAKRRGEPPLRRVSKWIFSAGGKGCIVACLFAVVMLLFAKPDFHISLADMNSMTAATREADRRFAEVWGQGEGKITLMATADSLTALRAENDRLAERVAVAEKEKMLAGALSPTAFYPGAAEAARRFAAWQAFFTSERAAALKRALDEAGEQLGFAADAFAGFTRLTTLATMPKPLPLPVDLGPLLGFSIQGDGPARQFILATPGENYDAAQFRADFGQNLAIFDPTYFATRLGDLLFNAFSESLALIALLVGAAVFFALLDWRLTLIALAPMLFASICTLGTLHILGRSLDIPALMLVVVIFGLGVDFSIYLVCGYQYYGAGDHPNYRLLQSAVLLSAASTLIGFGALIFARHSVLNSIGVVSFCGLGYSLVGAILLMPPLLDRYFRWRNAPTTELVQATIDQRVLHRYRSFPAWPRLFAREKLRRDTLFSELRTMLAASRPMVENHIENNIKKILDIGCGYGVPACWLLEYVPTARVFACDPDQERVFFAQRAVGERGQMLTGAAPDVPDEFPDDCDLILLLDMAHYLSDADLLATFIRCHALSRMGGRLAMRFVIRPLGKPSFAWHFEEWRSRLCGLSTYYRDLAAMRDLVLAAGFQDIHTHPSAKTEMFWLTARN